MKNKWFLILLLVLVSCSKLSTPTMVGGVIKDVPTAQVTITSLPTTVVPVETQTLLSPISTLEQEKYPWRKDVVATVFWGGEPPTEENNYIPNDAFAWTSDQNAAYGGVDSPDNRDPQNPYYPSFVPLENPFYVALPAAEYDENGLIPLARESSYWWKESVPEGESLFKNRWVEVRIGETSCYGQWEDVGPGNDRQYDYVFGNARTENEFGLHAGIDLSPAVAICLGADSEHASSWSTTVWWRFVDDNSVPEGPWLEIVTTSGPEW